jgi:myo-inositol 2-dehydrogenase / D-chiro-inositol 1-dehydrogenase
MSPIKVAVAGLGRMGQIHALHVHQIAKETGSCTLAALVDPAPGRAAQVASELGVKAPIFDSLEALAKSGAAEAAVIVTPTESHREHASLLIRAGLRVLMEKPLTGAVESAREFSAELDRDAPNGLMLAFQRRFDAPLMYAKELMEKGTVGRIFKIYSALEDSNPAPDGYVSTGILRDMGVHNVDEMLWFTGRMPEAAAMIGANLYSHRITTCQEDFDDALLYLWFDGMVAQVQVSRNHVSGYRVETVLYGEEGQIQIGHFDQKPFDIGVQVYGRRGSKEPISQKTFRMTDYGKPLPEFIDRFGPAYKAEVAAFVECCRSGKPFPTSHRDGLRAQEVISAGMEALVTPKQTAKVRGA